MDMNRKTFRRRVLECETLVGTHQSINDVSVSEMVGNAGFDYVWIDTEHSTVDYDHLQGMLAVYRATGTAAIVRVAWNDPILVKRILELGPDGIVFPMIRSVEEAQKAVKSCLYPPDGTRSYGPRRAMEYGRKPLAEYLNGYRERLAIILQVEHIDAVEHLDEIIDSCDADAYVIGPMDLAASMGKLADRHDPEVTAVYEKAIRTVRAHGKTAGLSIGFCPAEEYARWRDWGINMISSGADYAYIIKGSSNMRETLGEVFGK